MNCAETSRHALSAQDLKELRELPQSQLNVFSSLELEQHSVFTSISQAQLYQRILFFIKNGNDNILLAFVDFLVYDGHARADRWRKMSLKCLRNIIDLYFIRADDPNWINSPKIRLIIDYCIQKEVEEAKTYEDVKNSQVIDVIFTALTQHTNSRKFVTYLLEEILDKLEIDKMAT